MTDRPAVAFDMIGTTFSLESMRGRLEAAGLPPKSLETLFAQALRDYFALSHAGGYAPLKEVLTQSVQRILIANELDASKGVVDEVVAGLGELEPNEGAQEAFRSLTQANHKIVSLTNGSAEFTRGLLERSGLDGYVSSVISCDEIEVSKPHPRVYEYARESIEGLGWLVASHAWDCMGAMRAGLRAAWISSSESFFPDYLGSPDVTVSTLTEAAAAIVEESAS